MADETEAQYYQRRKSQARTMSAAAIDRHIRAIHRKFADRYKLLIVSKIAEADVRLGDAR